MDRIGKTVNMMKSLGPDHAQGSMKVTGEIHHSSGFEFTSISSIPDMSKTSPSHSEDSIDEKEGKQANRTSSNSQYLYGVMRALSSILD